MAAHYEAHDGNASHTLTNMTNVVTSVESSIAIVRLNRPAERNKLSAQTLHELYGSYTKKWICDQCKIRVAERL